VSSFRWLSRRSLRAKLHYGYPIVIGPVARPAKMQAPELSSHILNGFSHRIAIPGSSTGSGWVSPERCLSGPSHHKFGKQFLPLTRVSGLGRLTPYSLHLATRYYLKFLVPALFTKYLIEEKLNAWQSSESTLIRFAIKWNSNSF
jgi:hypothetical protein